MESLSEKYTVDWFINYFKDIPEGDWCVDTYTDKEGRHCALGHCMGVLGATLYLSELFEDHGLKVSQVNDGTHSKYQQEHPKDRVLAALQDIKNKSLIKLIQGGLEGVHLDFILDQIDEMLLKGEFSRVDNILISIDTTLSSTEHLLGVLTITLKAKEKLLNRKDFYQKVSKVLNERCEVESGLLLGLE